MQQTVKRPNRHSNPTKAKKGKGRGRFIFIHKKNQAVHEMMRENG
jgi:hypothetical protein